MTTNEEVLALHLRSARRMAESATRMLEAHVADIRRNTDRGEGSSSAARNIGMAVADLTAASAVIEMITADFDLTSVESLTKERK